MTKTICKSIISIKKATQYFIILFFNTNAQIKINIENHIEIQDFIDKIQEKNRQLYDIGDNEDEKTENEKITKPGE